MMGISALMSLKNSALSGNCFLAEILFAACFTKKRTAGKWLLPVGWLVFSLSAGIYVTYVLDRPNRYRGSGSMP